MKEYKVYVNRKRIKDIGISSKKETIRAKNKKNALKQATKRLRGYEIVGKVTVR